MTQQTHMFREIHEIPAATERLLSTGRAAIQSTAAAIRARNPVFVSTIARGSSDHAATFLKYACELSLGLPVASIGPSIASIFNARLKLADSACIAISQSGQSPDIVKMAQSATEQGAISVAITNQTASPLAEVCDHTLAIYAGVETSVAATKTFVTSAVAGLALLAHWNQDDELLAALDALPGHLQKALDHNWPELRSLMAGHSSLFILGRGPSIAVSHEAALKFKETCQIHAESYSSAEVLHGPVSIVTPGYPVLALASRDAAESSIVSVADELSAKGASVFITSDKSAKASQLGFTATSHPLTDPLALIVSFYAFIEKLAADRGIDPDAPRNLKKVTETV